jgi:dihydropteroate synthase
MPNHLNLSGNLMPLDSPKIMGILNCTPDSFYDGVQGRKTEDIVKKGLDQWNDGANLVDVGGQSSRPGAETVTAAGEWARIEPVIEGLLSAQPEILLSVDTFHAGVARWALDAGAVLINDITAGRDPDMWPMLAERQTPYVMMHMQGTPKTMQENPEYGDVVDEVFGWLSEKVYAAREAGLSDLIVDPGFGFGKSVEHNYALLRELSRFRQLEVPVLVGLSRKSMVSKPLEISAEEALTGTAALHAWALARGAQLLRVHDIKEARQVIHLNGLLQSNAVDLTEPVAAW